MQNGPRFLTDTDINTVYQIVNLTAGSGSGQTPTGLSVDLAQLGQVGQTADGRFYTLVSPNNGSTLAPGNLLVSVAPSSNYTGLAISATQPSTTAFGTSYSALSKGSLSFNVTNGSGAAITADQFAGGYVEVLQTSGTAEGPVSYKIAGNTAAATSAVCTLRLQEPLDQPEALVAGTDTVNLAPNPYFAVVTSATAGRPVGVNTVQVPYVAGNIYAVWAQTRGHVLVNSGAITVGNAFKQSTGTAGSVAATAAATDYAIGVALRTLGSAGTLAAHLNIA